MFSLKLLNFNNILKKFLRGQLFDSTSLSEKLNIFCLTSKNVWFLKKFIDFSLVALLQ